MTKIRARRGRRRGSIRLVAQNQLFVAFIPYAANSPFHLWIMPRLHRPSFLAVGDEELSCLASILRVILGKLYHGLGDPDGNLFTRLYPVEAIRSVLKECDFVAVTLPLSPPAREEAMASRSTAGTYRTFPIMRRISSRWISSAAS